MTGRDFGAEFSAMMVPWAAEDVELVTHFQAKMLGPNGKDLDQMDTAVVENMVVAQYGLNSEGRRVAVCACVAGLAGVQLGSEFFDGQA